jgi:predicted secreted acid phosphatase
MVEQIVQDKIENEKKKEKEKEKKAQEEKVGRACLNCIFVLQVGDNLLHGSCSRQKKKQMKRKPLLRKQRKTRKLLLRKRKTRKPLQQQQPLQ